MYDVKIEIASDEGFARILFCLSESTEQAVLIRKESDLLKLRDKIDKFIRKNGE